jgi:hypothetical protein
MKKLIKITEKELFNIIQEATVKIIKEEKDFLKKHDIKEIETGLGFSEKEQKWYGWSHRAIYGFGVGTKIKKGDVVYDGKEYTIKNLKQAKEVAKKFSNEVS